METGSTKLTEISKPTNSEAQISHLALDIGGSLIKLVYFSTNSVDSSSSSNESLAASNGDRGRHVLEGKLHFAKFETEKINDCIDFIRSKQLLLAGMLKCLGSQQEGASGSAKCVIKATGGGAYKFPDLFKEKLGISLDKADEMDCLVAGSNFLLKAVQREAFTYMDGQREFVKIDHDDLYPYLLVNIGSGVSMIKVDGPGKFERVSGTSVGGGTFWGLGKLLTKCKNFDELLELSHQGNNRVIDMLVGDIYGGMDYTKIGLISTAIASSFSKVISDDKELKDYKPEDISRSLLRMISNNIGQVSRGERNPSHLQRIKFLKLFDSVATFTTRLKLFLLTCRSFCFIFFSSLRISYLNALRFGLKRIIFAGFFIRGHAYTMDTIAVGVHFWSKGEAKAMFLKHEGFLGALGSFMSYEKHGFDDLKVHQSVQQSPAGDDPPNGELNENQSIDCSVYLSQ